MAPKVHIIIYTMYHHIHKLAVEVQKGLEASGVDAKIFQGKKKKKKSWTRLYIKRNIYNSIFMNFYLINILFIIIVPETLPEDVLEKLSAPPKPDVPVITVDDLKEADGFLFGIPTR